MSQLPPVTFDPRQQKIHEQLFRLGTAPAAFFSDACRLFLDLAQLESAGNLAGHLLRELKGSIKDVLYPRDVKEKSDRDAIEAIASAYGLPADHAVIEIWPNLRLDRLAHRGALASPRQLAEVQDAWEELQSVLAVLLDALDSAYTLVYQRLDRLLAKQAPGEADLRELTGKIPNNPHTLSYFFGKVQGRHWFELLAGSTVFDHPPEGGYWPQAEYLRRVAADYPEEVAPIIEKVAETWSYYTHHQIHEALPSLAPAAAARILKASAGAIMKASGHDTLLARDIAKRAAAIGKEEPQAALDVFATLLALEPSVEDPKGGYLGARELTSHFDYHTYMDVAGEPLHELIAIAPKQTFDRLLDLLTTVLARVYSESKPDDFSKGWMPAIEPHPQNDHHYQALPRLAESLRDAAEEVLAADPTALPAVIGQLDSHNWQVLHRLALHVLHRFGDPHDQLPQARVLDADVFFEWDHRHEYAALLKRVFPALSDADKGVILGWIKSGPRHMPDKVSAEDAQYQREDWTWQRLSWIRDHLSEQDATLLAELEKTHGTPHESEDFSGYISGPFWGPTSPKGEAELGEMTIPDLVSYLQSWEPAGKRGRGGFPPTREGLGRRVQPVVKARAAEFAAAAESFTGLDATFVRTVIEGLDEAVKANTVIAWELVLRLCAWAVAQPREIPGRDRKGFDNDPDWSWTWAAIARLLRTGFDAKDAAELPLSMRERVWAILAPITDDPDPDPSRESDERDPHSTAINSTRGVAMETVVRYAFWVRRNFFVPDGVTGFSDIPEVEQVLTRHLDITIDPSPAIRAVYGAWLYHLYRMNRVWVEAHVEKIFPVAQPNLADAVLHTYLAWSQFMTPELNRLLTPQFERAIESFPAIAESDEEKTPAYVRHVAQRVTSMYIHGEAELAPDSLVAKVYARADEATRAHAISLVPSIMDGVEEQRRSAMRERSIAFWEWRLASAGDAEIRGFGRWMDCDDYDPAWRLQQLQRVLERVGIVDSDYQVVGTLGGLAERFPAETLDCARRLVGTGIDAMRVYGLIYRGDLQRIIHAARASGNEDLRKEATAFANALVARGFQQFRAVLEPDYQPPEDDE